MAVNETVQEGFAPGMVPGNDVKREPVLSVVIVNWNTKSLLRRCLQTVRWNGTLLDTDVEVFVVDNASTDGSYQALAQEFPEVHWIQNESNVGFARANNQALRQAQGRYLLLLNPDTEVCPDVFEKLIRFMEADTGVGAVGPRLVNPDGTPQPSCYPFPTFRNEFRRLFHLESQAFPGPTSTAPYAAQSVEVLQGTCLLIRRRALEQVGLLDEEYFMYTEEVDLCYRMHERGWRLCWVPRAVVMHHGGQSTRQAQLEMFLHLYRSKVLFFRKQYGAWRARAYKLLLLAASLPRILLAPILGGQLQGTKKPWRATLAHYIRLMLNVPGM